MSLIIYLTDRTQGAGIVTPADHDFIDTNLQGVQLPVLSVLWFDFIHC